MWNALTPVDALGFLAAAIVFLTFCMRTMLTLRLIAIASNIAFIAYALAADLAPILVLHGALLPLNVLRLVQMRRQVQMTGKGASRGAFGTDFAWLTPFGTRRRFAAGEMIFGANDRADSLFVVVEGAVALPEIGATLSPGQMLGEIGLFSADRTRTATALAVGPTILAELTERQVRQLYFDNPQLAHRLIHLIADRLVERVRREDRPDAAPGRVRAG